jgi:aminoglycoside phosphotransferase (APT) family kinase protein
VWQFEHPDVHQHDVICHNDFAPYNIVFVDAQPYAMIDFDTAGPGPRIWDVAFAAYYFVPLSYSADLRLQALIDLAHESRRLQQFCTAYGIAATTALLDTVDQRLQALCTTLIERAAAGDDVYTRMIDQGHLVHYEREIRAFQEYRPTLERNLGGNQGETSA